MSRNLQNFRIVFDVFSLLSMYICPNGRRDMLSWEEVLNLTSFLGEQLRNLHLLPCPSLKKSTFSDIKLKVKLPFADGYMEDIPTPKIPEEWNVFIRTLCRRKMNVTNRLENW